MSATRFTDTQGQYLAFIDAYTRVHGRPPAETDMQRHFRVSPPSVHQRVLTLERLGLVRRQPGVARSIEVLLAPEDLPVLRHPEPIKSSVPRNPRHQRLDAHVLGAEEEHESDRQNGPATEHEPEHSGDDARG
jgi:SOS-response transcriptional repressor LexA